MVNVFYGGLGSKAGIEIAKGKKRYNGRKPKAIAKLIFLEQLELLDMSMVSLNDV